MVDKYSFFETNIAYETFLYYNMEGPSIPDHREIILENADKLRIVPYTHQFPDGSESICYHIQGYAALEKVFRKRQLNFEELVLLLYGVVHTISNAKKCGLVEDSFVLDPNYLFLSHNSIQPYLMYLPAMLDMSLRDEFLALLNFLDGSVDPSIPNTKKLVSVLRTITADDFDMSTIINIVVQAANKNEVAAPKRTASAAKPAPATPKAAKAQVSASAEQTQPSKPTPVRQPTPIPPQRTAPPVPNKGETKKGFFARFFAGWSGAGRGVKEKEEEDFLPSIDDRTMIDFTAYGDGEGRPMLYVMEGDSRAGQIPVTSDAFVLGRNRGEVDYCFDGADDKSISRVHATIIYDGSSYFVTDKGSAGGTFVNGVRLAPGGSAPLRNGDIVSLYKKQLLFEIAD